MDIREGWFAVLLIAACLVGFIIGRSLAWSGDASDCTKLRKFQYMGDVYECRKLPRSSE